MPRSTGQKGGRSWGASASACGNAWRNLYLVGLTLSLRALSRPCAGLGIAGAQACPHSRLRSVPLLRPQQMSLQLLGRASPSPLIPAENLKQLRFDWTCRTGNHPLQEAMMLSLATMVIPRQVGLQFSDIAPKKQFCRRPASIRNCRTILRNLFSIKQGSTVAS